MRRPLVIEREARAVVADCMDAGDEALFLADFVDAVRSSRPPTVDGAQGRRALALAKAITDKITVAS